MCAFCAINAVLCEYIYFVIGVPLSAVAQARIILPTIPVLISECGYTYSASYSKVVLKTILLFG
jgi:hypothetical protein